MNSKPNNRRLVTPADIELERKERQEWKDWLSNLKYRKLDSGRDKLPEFYDLPPELFGKNPRKP